jgi:hypothetical protein
MAGIHRNGVSVSKKKKSGYDQATLPIVTENHLQDMPRHQISQDLHRQCPICTDEGVKCRIRSSNTVFFFDFPVESIS